MAVSDATIREVRDDYLEPKGDWARNRVARVMRAASLSRGALVLDLGCGEGTFSYHAKLAGARPIGLDRDESVLKEGREIALAVGGFATPRVQGDARQLPFPNCTFDYIINADFIEHTPDDAKIEIFREMHRALKTNGRALIYSPNLNRVQWELRSEHIKCWLRIRSKPVPTWRDFVDPDHFGMTTPRKCLRLLRLAGFHTAVDYYEFHVPFLSKIPGLNRLLELILSAQFANRYLIRLSK